MANLPIHLVSLNPNLRYGSCRGVIGVRLNKNQLLFKGIMVQASRDMLDKIYSSDDYLWECMLLSCPELLLNF